MDDYKNYAFDAVFYIMKRLPDSWMKIVDSVVLFGSVAQGTATDESDIDLFFDVSISKALAKKFRIVLDKIIESFYLSDGALKHKLEGIDIKISVNVGKLSEWNDLKRSIISTGIVLYGRYKEPMKKSGLKQHFLIAWDPPGKNRGSFLNKLYGYSVKKKRYAGIMNKYNCIKIGKSTIITPSIHKDKIMAHMQKYGVSYRIMEIFM